MTGDVDAYPLTWPVGWPRTPDTRRTETWRYKVSFADARDELVRSVQLLGGESVVVSSNVPTRRDGLPFASYSEPTDPGVAVYWVERIGSTVTPRAIACDAWLKVRDNMRAVGLAVDGLRALRRSGASQVVERAFTGFAALPATTSSRSAPHWRDVLGLRGTVTREQLDATYKRLAVEAHPDRPGGSHERMSQINRARSDALRELGDGRA